MNKGRNSSEGSVLRWFIWGPLLVLLLLYLPLLLSVTEYWLLGTNKAYEWFRGVGIVDLLDPFYERTIERLY